MKKTLIAIVIASVSTMTVADTTIVTQSNFAHAETVHYFNLQLDEVDVNEWKMEREPVNMHNQTIIRSNIDLLYQTAVVDAKGGATISVPQSDVYQIAQIIDENHYIVDAIYPGESKTITPDMLTTGQHFYILKRTAIDAGIEEARRLQDETKIEATSATPYKGKAYDVESLNTVRSELEKQGPGTIYALGFGRPDQVQEPHFSVASATGWGGLSGDHAQYLLANGTGDISQCGAITMQVPPLDFDNGGYFSVIQYDSKGWIDVEKAGYSASEMTPNSDGSYTFHLSDGSCADKLNHIEVADNSYYWGVRLYKPTDAAALTEYIKALHAKGITAVK
ncbi:murein transglycosylase [Vibrio inusitatus NBRC 102082]|uniref:Murein transglycosylase n=1 Tax=Vibrio inusitatus NBRC 102082 TaxID=1219070 RepID=A0A4Y3HWT4_9VIBR|nr:lytic murein transglycosylase [Vibrio inusitatus]GEA51478.1 murein transglycosylase [Vibrio inusitatus NBRC 102082]